MMGQEKEKRLLIFPKELFENMWGKNLLFKMVQWRNGEMVDGEMVKWCNGEIKLRSKKVTNKKETKLSSIGNFGELRDTS